MVGYISISTWNQHLALEGIDLLEIRIDEIDESDYEYIL